MRDELSQHLKNKNYHMVEYPKEEDKSTYSTDERRSYILDIYLNGKLKEKSKTELADAFDIRRNQLYKDMNIIKLWIRENPHGLVDDTIQKQTEIINKLMEEGRLNQAGMRNEKRLEVLQEAGLLDKPTEKKKIEKETTVKQIGFNTVNEIDPEEQEDDEE